LQKAQIPTACIAEAIVGALAKLDSTNASLVIYGERQSRKTEMMIWLTAKLFDGGHRIIVHLMNDSADLLTQNLKRFKASGLAPADRNSSELSPSFVRQPGHHNSNGNGKLFYRYKWSLQFVPNMKNAASAGAS
jgi:hypothetical protein